jgi:hypothetical protein
MIGDKSGGACDGVPRAYDTPVAQRSQLRNDVEKQAKQQKRCTVGAAVGAAPKHQKHLGSNEGETRRG